MEGKTPKIYIVPLIKGLLLLVLSFFSLQGIYWNVGVLSYRYLCTYMWIHHFIASIFLICQAFPGFPLPHSYSYQNHSYSHSIFAYNLLIISSILSLGISLHCSVGVLRFWPGRFDWEHFFVHYLPPCISSYRLYRRVKYCRIKGDSNQQNPVLSSIFGCSNPLVRVIFTIIGQVVYCSILPDFAATYEIDVPKDEFFPFFCVLQLPIVGLVELLFHSGLSKNTAQKKELLETK
eukprot:gnl/Carplike_NY0171/5008_a6832_317.p1 GENE.gnl/Carplike_NY0171/5008_a6832_317~~gnl/Carplike_NY0171/5008_a6832_317.p1  ORF type:complete len:234 (-),score=5.20 gnl/Carplike_NY0171/5008_a6832_317:139-840(-)